MLLMVVLVFGGVGAALWWLLWPQPKEQVAANIMSLPPEARVVRAEYGEWSGDGDVEFRLPPSRTPERWLDAVWAMNSTDPQVRSAEEGATKERTRRSRSVTLGVHRRALTYDPSRDTYHYHVMLEK